MILEGFVIIVSRDDWLNRVCGNVMAGRKGVVSIICGIR